jgi:hypothetical protein
MSNKLSDLGSVTEAEARIRNLKHFEWGLFDYSIERIIAVMRGEPKCECGWPNTTSKKVCKTHGFNK